MTAATVMIPVLFFLQQPILFLVKVIQGAIRPLNSFYKRQKGVTPLPPQPLPGYPVREEPGKVCDRRHPVTEIQ